MVKVFAAFVLATATVVAQPPRAPDRPAGPASFRRQWWGATRRPTAFQVEEATIPGIQQALLQKQVTTVGLVERYLWRIQAYNGTCVNQPQGILGPITTIPHARQINALATLNLRPAARTKWGFDARKTRSVTDGADSNPA